MAAHLNSSRNERGRQVSSSQVIKFDEPVKQEEKSIVKESEIKEEPKVEEIKKIFEVKNDCLKLGYDFNLYVEFNNLDLSDLLTDRVDVTNLDKIEIYSKESEKSMFLMKSFTSHFKLEGELFDGITFSGFEINSKCYCKMILLTSDTKQKLIYSQRRM